MQNSEEESKVKEIMKKKLKIKIGLAAGGIVSSLLVIVILCTGAAVLISPVFKFTSLVERLSNTFTKSCFFCTIDDVEEKTQEKFYKKVQKIDSKYKRGTGMDKWGNNVDKVSPSSNPSIQLDIALLISSALMDRTMSSNISNINGLEDAIEEDFSDGTINNNENNVTQEDWSDLIEGDGLTSLWKLSWYEAEGDPTNIYFEGCGMDESRCVVQRVEFATNKDPKGASVIRRLAKHMVKRTIHWDIHRYSCGTEEEPHTCWETNSWYEYNLSVEKEDESYTVKTDEQPYVSVIEYPRSEEQVNGSTSSFVTYLLSTYIPEHFYYDKVKENSKNNLTYSVLPNPEKVSKQEYLDAKKKIKNYMYYYKYIYDSIAKYISTQNQSLCSYGGSCEYTVDGETYSNIKVKLLQCGDETRGEPIVGENLVDFEKYIMGVVYAENANGSFEALKAQAVAARSYALMRGKTMGTRYLQIYQENGQWILPIRNCTEDQVYCDPDRGCSTASPMNASGKTNTVYSGTDTKTYTYKKPLPADSDIRRAVTETTGEVLMDHDTIYYATYTDATQNEFNKLASQGFEYNQILATVYGQGLEVKSSCDHTCAASGDFTNWKQTDPAWKDVVIGSPGGPLGNIGCLVTSLAIQIANSGTVPFDDFNPGSFARALNQIGAFGSGGSLMGSDYVTSVAPDFYRAYSTDNTGGFGSTQAAKTAKIKAQLEDGCYPIVRVKGTGHFVAVDRVEGDNVYIFDPDPSNNTGMLWPFYDVGSTTLSTCWKAR